MFLRTLRPIAMVLTWSLLSGSVVAQTDVAGTRYAEAYAYLQQQGAVQSGRPRDPLRRVEALKVVLELQEKYRDRLDWYKEHRSSLPLFRDLSQDAWYAPYVEAGFESSIVTGYPDHTFRPGNILRVEEAVALLLRSYGVRTNPALNQEEWFKPFVKAALDRNLVSAQEQLFVGYPITRGQFFDMAYRMDNIMTRDLLAFGERDRASGSGPRIVLPEEQAALRLRPGETQYASATKDFSITIPRLGIHDLTITHPRDALTSKGQLEVLQYGVGHLFSYPGRGGKIMVYGHSSSYAWDVSQFTKIFTKVNELKAGDRVYVTYAGKLHVYEVTHQQTISPNDIRPFTGKGEELILFTCWPIGTAKSRLLVHATPVAAVAVR